MSAKKIENRLFSNSEIDLIRAEFTELTGNRLGQDKRVLIESRLRKRLNELKIQTKDYIKLVKSDPEESSRFISALTTHKTDWFREPQHFAFLNEQIDLGKQDGGRDAWSIWSAASSTGEEGYSIAFSFLEKNIHRFRVLGTDISQECLQKASLGIYDKEDVDHQVRLEVKKKYFLSGTGAENSESYKVLPDIQSHFKWRQFNLISDELPVCLKFDIIFLRNVLIYFDQPQIVHIVERLTQYLNVGGYFIVGLSETVPQCEQFNLMRFKNSIYQKVK